MLDINFKIGDLILLKYFLNDKELSEIYGETLALVIANRKNLKDIQYKMVLFDGREINCWGYQFIANKV